MGPLLMVNLLINAFMSKIKTPIVTIPQIIRVAASQHRCNLKD